MSAGHMFIPETGSRTKGTTDVTQGVLHLLPRGLEILREPANRAGVSGKVNRIVAL